MSDLIRYCHSDRTAVFTTVKILCLYLPPYTHAHMHTPTPHPPTHTHTHTQTQQLRYQFRLLSQDAQEALTVSAAQILYHHSMC